VLVTFAAMQGVILIAVFTPKKNQQGKLEYGDAEPLELKP